MKVIGITGGVGAGKSSVLALLKEMCSCDIIQADLVARNIYQSGNIGFKKVVDIFGEQIVGEDGEITDLFWQILYLRILIRELFLTA